MKSRQQIVCSSSSSHMAFLFYVVMFLTTTISATYGTNETDHLALLSFKSMITDPYGALSSWNTSFHFCDWGGVSCGKGHRRVTVIRLESQSLVGYLTPHIGNLSFLRVFSLKNNTFQGTIPHQLDRLFRLRVLRLESNKFNGVIPANLSRCSNLELLDFSYNELVGSIPKELGFLSKLTFVSLGVNNLTGGIPPFLGNITSIEVFSVSENLLLSGSIPDTLGHWKSLRGIYSGECNLHGAIPHSIYNLSLLTSFVSPMNQLTGMLPPDIGSMLPNLLVLQLRNNQLTGLLPPSISNFSKLQLLEMSDNNFSGKLTINFAKLRDIYAIVLGNKFYGRGEANQMKLIDSLENCSRLETLSLRNSNFQGMLPISIGNLSDRLSVLDLSENKIYGNLPSSIGNLVGLIHITLGSNQFTGRIPSTIGMLQKLEMIDLYGNQLSGEIPDAIGNLSMLSKLFLYSNRLEGHIPSSLGNCHRLLDLYLYGNKLSGEIPKQLVQLSSISITLDLSYNDLSGSLPIEVGDLKMLGYLDLSHNNLSGSIPNTLGSCTSLSYLILKGNLFQGLIPQSFRFLKGVVVLELSHNNLSGQIPKFLEGLSLEYIDLSFNSFIGEVSVLGVFANASAFSVLGNSRLCGGLAELGLPNCKETRKHKKTFLFLIVVSLIASSVFITLSFVYLWCNKKRKGQLTQLSLSRRFLKVSYNQLLKATNGFSHEKLIGVGGFSSVYQGILCHDDRFVAVKVLHLQNQGAHRSFMTECEVWRSIRHRNLLKIITSCSSVDFQGNDFKALVYEFMPNGSLHDLLHSNASTSILNLLQRIKILIDVATALDYLHSQCLATIVHGDLKPSNILLDDDMVAHVGDFGLAQFLGTDSNENISTRIAGTIGYAPPEYGLGNPMTTNGDVYSFGILLLEVMTRKKPTDAIFNERVNLHKFASMALPDHVTEVIDGDLLDYPQEDAISMQTKVAIAKKMEECMASTVKIGVSCSVDHPTQRMNMSNVVHELQYILDTLQNV